MRKFLTATGLLLVGYLVGFRKGNESATRVLVDAHFKACPDTPLVLKSKNVEMTVTKLQPETTTEEESE